MRRLDCLIVFALLAAGLCGLWPQGTVSAQDDLVIFATSADSGEAKLYRIDPDTGEATEMGDTGFNRLSALEFDDSGVLYGIGEDDDGDSVLITINLRTGEGTLVGETGIEDGGFSVAVPGCSYDESDGTLYAFAVDGSLYTIDLDDGTATLVGTDEDADLGGGNALGFDSDGNLYRCDYDELYSVDTSDGTNTYEDDLAADNPDDVNDTLDWLRGMDWWDDSSVFYGVVGMWDDSAGDWVHYLGTLDPTDPSAVDLIGITENLGAIAVADVSVLGAAPEITAGPTATPTKVSFASGSVDFSVTASDDDGDTLSYSWNFGDGGTATGASPTHVYTASGEFDVTVTVSDVLLETTGSVKVTVNHPATIDTGPSADPQTVSPTVGEIDFSATASDLDGDPLTYDWDFGDTESASGADVSHTYADSGDYTVTLTVNDGFDDTVATVDVLVNNPPAIDNGPTADPNPVSLASSTIDFSVTA
ncbi:MAG: PKD domain-containing protein, partial [Planctomycetota bacterium]